eukprot:bmy_18007T0
MGQDPTEHARRLAAASGAQVEPAGPPVGPRGGGAGARSGSSSSFLGDSTFSRTLQSALAPPWMHLGGRGNLLLAFGFGGEDGNGELPGKGGYRQERSKLRNPERCFQCSHKLLITGYSLE